MKEKNSSFQAYAGMIETVLSDEIDVVKESLRRKGMFLQQNVFSAEEIDMVRAKMDTIWNMQLEEYGEDFLRSINDYGSIRCMMDYDSFFLDLVRDERIFKTIAGILGDSAILHLQNGIMLFPEQAHNQSQYHKDFPKNIVTDEQLSVNALIVIDPFTKESGATLCIAGSHAFKEKPSNTYIQNNEVQIIADPGDVLFFDSMLWHKGGENTSSNPRRSINQQYTKPFIKQQISYPDLLKDKVDRNTPLGQTLGMWAVPPKSLKEFRVDSPEKRTYKADQG